MKTLIIAEAGVNHNGSLSIAKKLIDAASDAKADVIKFQTFKPEALSSSVAPTAEYQKRNTGIDQSQLDMLKSLTLAEQDYIELINHCKSRNIQFCSSPFDLQSIDFLKSLDMPLWKIPSGEITNLPYLRKIAALKMPVIISTGMSFLGEIESVVSVFTESGLPQDKITLLHCNTEYPTPPADVNLNCLKTLQQAFGVSVGYSDHTLGIEFPIAAVALGATVIEKHITLDKTMDGPDHRASLEPDELTEMVKSIRNIEIGMGSSIKKPSDSEVKNIAIARKSIVADRDIIEGMVFSEENLTVKRPGTGLSPMMWDSVIGLKARRNFSKDECIEIF